MRKFRIWLAALLASGIILMTGCSERENIPIPSLSDSRSTVSSAESDLVPEGSSSESADSTASASSAASSASAGDTSSAEPEISSSASKPASSSSASKPASSSSVSKPASSSSASKPASSSSASKPVSSSSASKPASSSPSENVPRVLLKCDRDGSDLVFDNGVIPDCKNSGLTCGIHCSECGCVFSKQTRLSNVHSLGLTKITEPSNGLDGSLSYACKGCGYTFNCTYNAGLNEKNVYNTLVSMKEVYPEGTPFDNSTKYVSKDIFPMVIYTGKGCAGFAMELSDKAFGKLPARYHFDFTKIRVGDIVRTLNNQHSVIVLKVEGNIITVAEGNYNSSVHWGRKLDITDPSIGWAYVMTRYPE